MVDDPKPIPMSYDDVAKLVDPCLQVHKHINVDFGSMFGGRIVILSEHEDRHVRDATQRDPDS